MASTRGSSKAIFQLRWSVLGESPLVFQNPQFDDFPLRILNQCPQLSCSKPTSLSVPFLVPLAAIPDVRDSSIWRTPWSVERWHKVRGRVGAIML